MGKIIASYLLKVHLHLDDEQADPSDAPSNEDIKEAVIDGIDDNLGFTATVSEIDRSDD